MAQIANSSIAISIGAALSAGFASAFGAATQKITAIGGAISQLRGKVQQFDAARAVQDKFTQSVTTLTGKQDRYKTSVAAAQQRVASLKTQMAALGAPTQANSGALATFATRLDAAQQAELRAGNALSMTTAQLEKEKAGLVTATANAEKYTAGHQHIGASLKQLEGAYASYNRSADAVARNDEKRSKYRASFLEIAAASMALRKLVMMSSEREEAVMRLKWVLRSDNPEQAVGVALAKAKEFARTSLATVPEMLKIEMVLSKAGFEADVARLAAETAHKVSSVTEQDAEETARVIANIYNQAARNMTGAPEEKFKRIGDLVAQLQHQFDFKEGVAGFGEQLAHALPKLEAFHIPIAQAGAAFGVLKQQGLDAGKIPMVLTRLDKAAKDLGFSLIHDAKGNLDFTETIRSMNFAVMQTYGSIDAGKDAIAKAFGGRGADIMLALAHSTNRVREEQERMAREMPGVVGREYAEMVESTAGKLAQLKKNFESLLIPIGSALIPGLNAVLTPLGTMAEKLGAWLDEHKGFAQVIGSGAASLFLLSAATYAVGYALTFIKAPFLAAIKFYDYLKVAALAAAAAETVEAGAGTAAGASMAARGPVMGRFVLWLSRIGKAGAVAAAGETAAGTAAAGASTGFGVLAASIGPVLLGLASIAGAVAVIGKAFLDMRANMKRTFDDAAKLQLRKDIASGKVKPADLRAKGYTNEQIQNFLYSRESGLTPGGEKGAKDSGLYGWDEGRLKELLGSPDQQSGKPSVAPAPIFGPSRLHIILPQPVGAAHVPETPAIHIVGMTPGSTASGKQPKGHLARMPQPISAGHHALSAHHVRMPHMAMGGIVTRPTIAQIGEAGPEAVIPLGKQNQPWWMRRMTMTELGDAVYNAMPAFTKQRRMTMAELGHGITATGSGLQNALVNFSHWKTRPSWAEFGGELKNLLKPRTAAVAGLALAGALSQIERARTPRPEVNQGPAPITMTNSITIQVAAGNDERKIGREVRSQLEDMMRTAEARRRGAMHD